MGAEAEVRTKQGAAALAGLMWVLGGQLLQAEEELLNTVRGFPGLREPALCLSFLPSLERAGVVLLQKSLCTRLFWGAEKPVCGRVPAPGAVQEAASTWARTATQERPWALSPPTSTLSRGLPTGPCSERWAVLSFGGRHRLRVQGQEGSLSYWGPVLW